MINQTFKHAKQHKTLSYTIPLSHSNTINKAIQQNSMDFKLANDFKGCLTIILSSNLKDKIEREGVCSLSSIPLQNLKVYLVKEILIPFLDYLLFFLLIFSLFFFNLILIRIPLLPS